jgi:ATP-binding cassette subfamily B multidrug efflux pump
MKLSATIKNLTQNLRDDSRLLRFYLRKYRRPASIGVAALVSVDLLEALPPILLKEAVDAATHVRPQEFIFIAAGAYVGVTILQSIGRYLWRMYLIRASMWAGRDLRDRYAEHLFRLGPSFYDKKRIGDLMSLATNDVEAIRMAIGAGLLTLADAVFYLLSVPIFMWVLSPKLTLLAFAPFPLVPLLVIRCERLIHERFQKVQDSFGGIAAFAQEGLNGVRVIKAYAREDAQVERFRSAGQAFIELNLRLSRVQSAFGPMLDFLMTLGMVLILWYGGQDVIGGAVSLGTFVAFQRYLQKLVWPMSAVGMAVTMYQRAVASGTRYQDILDTQSDVQPPQAPLLPSNANPGGPWKTSGRVELKNLTFAFPGTKVPVLKNISLQIEPGERVAFLGAVGAGKSALLSLLPRLYPVENGMILIDGVDVNRWPVQELRAQVGFVSQEVFLFSETVLDNLGLAVWGWKETPDQIALLEAASRTASVHDEVARMSQGWRTRLGERGANLSGGQRQRLTLARALAKEPPILVLDDALSSVDTQTEEKILEALRARPGRNTELVAAHRISTVRDANRIVVLERGEVRQVGTHTQLMSERRGSYRLFYEQQRLKEDLEQYTEQAPATPEGGTPE